MTYRLALILAAMMLNASPSFADSHFDPCVAHPEFSWCGSAPVPEPPKTYEILSDGLSHEIIPLTDEDLKFIAERGGFDPCKFEMGLTASWCHLEKNSPIYRILPEQ